MKKTLALLLAVVMMVGLLAGCGGTKEESKAPESQAPASTAPEKAPESSAPTIDFPTKPITLNVPYGAGGGSDVGARLLCAEVEKILGQPITIVNQPGAGGWIGWAEMLQQDADGYYLGHTNTPNLVVGYIDPQQQRDNSLDQFAPIICYVSDPGSISINPDETRFNDFASLVEYAKANETTVAVTGANGDDDIAMKKLNKALGTNFIPVIYQGASDTVPAVMGGHVDVLIANVGEVKNPTENGDLNTVALLSAERVELMPDVPTVKELTGVEITAQSARGICAPAGIDPEILKILQDAFAAGAASEEFKANMAEQGLNVVSIVGDDYMAMMQQEEQEIKDLAPMLGWDLG